jgi:ribonuclease HI
MSDRHDGVAGEMDRLPTGTLSPLAARAEAVLALYGYELTRAIDAIDAAVPGYGGLFEPQTTDAERRAALDEVATDPPPRPTSRPASRAVLYVDGSSRGNPGPAGAGAVVQVADEAVAKLGCPVGSRTGNNVAEYAALHLGLGALVERCGPESVEIRIDSMTVIDDIWGDGSAGLDTPHDSAIDGYLARIPAVDWTHLADSDPNPADARATVAADIAGLGPG